MKTLNQICSTCQSYGLDKGIGKWKCWHFGKLKDPTDTCSKWWGPSFAWKRAQKPKKAAKHGACWLCGIMGFLTEHHSKPSWAGLKKEGPVIFVCLECHKKVHKRFSNAQLRAMSLEELKMAWQGPARSTNK